MLTYLQNLNCFNCPCILLESMGKRKESVLPITQLFA